MKSSKSRKAAVVLAAAVTAAVMGGQRAQADTYTYKGNSATAQSWNAAANWTPSGSNPFPNAAGDIANITNNITQTDTINLNVPITVGVINIGDSTTAFYSFTIAANGGSLTLDNAGSNAQINQTSTSNGDTISAPITLASDLVVSNAAASKTLTLSGGITGAKNITINANAAGAITLSTNDINNAGSITNSGSSSGTTTISANIGSNVTSITQNSATSQLTLSGTNSSFTGSINLNAGVLYAGSATALGTGGTINFGGGTLKLSNTTDYSARFSQAAGQVYNIDTNGQNVTFATPFTSVGGSFNKTTGTGNLILLGASTYTGGTTIGAGVLQLGNGTTTDGSIVGNIVNNAQLWVYNNVSDVTLSGNISGTGSITKNNAGGLTLSGNNSYSGVTTLNGTGKVTLGSATALGSGSGSLVIGGTIILDSSVANLVLSTNNAVSWNNSFTFAGSNNLNLGTGNVTMNASRTVTVTANTLTMGGVVSGSTFTLSKNGLGTLELTAAGTYSGGTIVNGGTLKLSGTAGKAGTGTMLVTVGTTLNLDNTAGVADRLADAAAILNAGSFNLIGNASANTSETAGALTLTSGGSIFTLSPGSGFSANLTFASLARNTGVTTLYRGTSLGSVLGADTTNVTFTTNPTVTASGTFAALDTVGTRGTTNAAVLRGALADTSATGNGAGFATLDTNGVRVLDSSTEQSTTYAAGNANIRLDLTGAVGITGAATNTLQLANTSGSAQTVTNTGTALDPKNGLLFSGSSAITLNGGTFNHADASGDIVILSTNTAGVTIGTAITNNGNSQAVDRGVTISGSGPITLNGAITLFSTSNTAASAYFNINNSGTTILNAVVAGGSTSTSTGAHNYLYTNLNAGTLKLGASGSLGSVANYGSKSGSYGTYVYLTLAPGTTFDMNGVNVTINNISGAYGTVTNTSATAATLKLTDVPNFSYDNFSVTCDSRITGNINLSLGGGTNYPTSYNNITLSGTNDYTGTTTIAHILNGTNGRTFSINIANPYAIGLGKLVLQSGTFDNTSGAAMTLPRNNLQDWYAFDFRGTNDLNLGTGAVTLKGNVSVLVTAKTLTVGGAIGEDVGGRTLTKTGVGTLVFNGTNTYTGATTVTAGTLTVNAGATLSGATAPLVVSNPNTGAGTTVSMNLNSSQTVGSLSGTMGTPSSGTNVAQINLIGASTVLTVNQTAANSYAGILAGTGGFTLGSSSNQTLSFSGINTYTGATTISGGTLAITGTGSINGTSGISINGGTLQYSSSTALTQPISFSGTGGTVVMDSSSTYSGAMTVASGNTLGGHGTLSGTVTIDTGGTLSPGNSPGQITVGTLILNSGSTSHMEIGGTTLGTGYDNVTITSNNGLTYGGLLEVVSYGGYDLTQVGSYNLFTLNSGTPSGDFSNVTVGGTTLSNSGGVWTGISGGSTYQFTEASGILTVTIPEPATASLMLGVVSLGLMARRRKRMA